jgi:transposase-like protein
MDAESKTIIYGKYGVSENSEKQLTAFFMPLIERGLKPTSCTVDGNPQVIKVMRRLWPGITIQRCLVHIQRQGLSWCRRYPKTVHARQLRKIFVEVMHIHTLAEREEFLDRFYQWEEKYGKIIKTRPEKGWVFSDIKRARSMLQKALPDMFYYLNNPAIPSTTNGMEGYFSRLKLLYLQHRGLSKNKLDNYFAWYFFFKPR